MPTLREAAEATIEWLKTNPDNRITGDLARDNDHNLVAANSPDAACFCTLGYLARQLDLPVRTLTDLYPILREGYNEDPETNDAIGDIWWFNDHHDLPATEHAVKRAFLTP